MRHPQGLRRIGGKAYLDGRRVHRDDVLELRLETGEWVSGYYWYPPTAAWPLLVCSDRWICYILTDDSLLRWPVRHYVCPRCRRAMRP